MKKRHPFGVSSLSWSPDGQFLAVGGNSRKVFIWEIATQRQVSLILHEQSQMGSVTVHPLAWSPDGTRLATAGGDKTVRLWEVATGNLLLTYHEHEQTNDYVSALAWSPDSRLIATGDWGGVLRVWEAASGTQHWASSNLSGIIRALAWSPDGQRLALAANGPRYFEPITTIQVWEATSGNLLLKKSDLAYMPYAAIWSPDSTRLLVVGSSPGRSGTSGSSVVQEWDTNSGQLLQSAEHPFPGEGALLWLPGEQPRMAATDVYAPAGVEVWEPESGHHVYTYRGHRGGVGAVAWSPDGKRVASGGRDQTVQVWEPTLDN